MRKLLSILFLLFSFSLFGQTTYTDYLPDVAWRTLIDSVVYQGTDTFTVKINPIDINDPGAFNKVVGDFLIDNKGRRYEIIDSATVSTYKVVTVVDVFESGAAPYQGLIGWVYNSAGGSEKSISAIQFEELDNKAFDYGYRIDMDILWRQADLYPTDSVNIVWFADLDTLSFLRQVDTTDVTGLQTFVENHSSSTTPTLSEVLAEGNTTNNQTVLFDYDGGTAAEFKFGTKSYQFGEVFNSSDLSVSYGTYGGSMTEMFKWRDDGITEVTKLKIGYSTLAEAGALRYSSGNFQGYNGSDWVTFGSGGSSLWTADTYGITYSAGNVGIGGASSSVYDLKVTGLANITSSLVVNGLIRTDDHVYMHNITAPSAPAPNYGKLYMSSADGKLYFRNSATTYDLTGGGGSLWTEDTNGITYSSGNVSIGTTAITSSYLLRAHCDISSGYAAWFNNSSSSGNGVLIQGGNGSTEYALRVTQEDGAAELFSIRGDGSIYANNITSGTTSNTVYYDTSTKQLTYGAASGGGDMYKSSYDTDDDGDIDVSAGGTNIDWYTVGDILYASGNQILDKLSAGPVDYVLTSNGAGVAPSWKAASSGSSYWESGTNGIEYTDGTKNVGIRTAAASNAMLKVADNTGIPGGYGLYVDNYSSGGNGALIQGGNGSTEYALRVTQRSYDGADLFNVRGDGKLYAPKLGLATSDTVLYLSGGLITKGLAGASGSGSVTSVGLTSTDLTITGSPITTSGTITANIAASGVQATHLNNNIISGKTALTSGLASTDELLISDAGTVKRMDVSVLQSYMQDNLSFSEGGGVTSVAAGNGMNFTTITDTGSVTMGTPSSITTSSTNSLTSTSHTHALDLSGRSVSTQYSLTGGGNLGSDRTLNLVGDVASPGNSKYYGTNSSGTRGFYDLPTGSGPSVTVQSLSGKTPSWNMSNGINGKITLSGNTTITLSNVPTGYSGNLTVTNAATAYTITFGGTGYTFKISPVLDSSSGVITMSGGSEIDVLSWYYDGTYVIINGTFSYD